MNPVEHELEPSLPVTDPQEQPIETSVHTNADKYLCFQIDSELYGFELEDVQEILRDVTITRVPNTESWLLGVANLRGRVTPIFDLRKRLNACEKQGAKRWVVVLEVEVEEQRTSIGAVVDSLPEVVALTEKDIQSRADNTGHSNFVVALGRTETQVVLLLNPTLLIKDSYQAMENIEE